MTLTGICRRLAHSFGASGAPHNFFGEHMGNSLLDLADLADLLGRSPETIKKDIRRNRLAVPPRLHIP